MNNSSDQNQNTPSFNSLVTVDPSEMQSSAIQGDSTADVDDDKDQQLGKVTWIDVESFPVEEKLSRSEHHVSSSNENFGKLVDNSWDRSLQPLYEIIGEIRRHTEIISDELGTAYNDFNTEIKELKRISEEQDHSINDLNVKINQINSSRQLEIDKLIMKLDRVNLLWEHLDKISQRITELEQLQTFSVLKDLSNGISASNYTEACIASLGSLKDLKRYSLDGIEQGIDSFPEDIKKLFYQVKGELEEIEAQNRECDKLLAILRRRLMPDSLVSSEKLLRERVPELFLTLCKFALRTNQRALLEWLTSRGFEGFASIGLRLINPTNGDDFDKNTCIPVSTAVAPSIGMRGKVAACLCPGLVIDLQKTDDSPSEYCYAPAEISLYT